MILIMSLITSILLALAIFLIVSQEPSRIEKRIKKTKKKPKGIFNKLLENFALVMSPISKKNLSDKKGKEHVRILLMQAGLDSSEDNILLFESKRLLSTAIVSVICIIVSAIFRFNMIALGVCVFVVYIAYSMPTILLRRQIDKRQKDLMKNLPDAIDLLAICLQAGLGLDASLARIANEFSLSSKTIAIEFSRLNKDIISGIPRQEAYRNLVLRNPNRELKSFIALLIQSDKLGTSISLSLRAYCDSVRTRKKQRVEELSQQASSKMTIPMVLFMLPAIFIIILYPAVVKIMESSPPV